MLGAWLREQVSGYVDNPVALRDFRVQFRNGRMTALFIIFTLLAVLVSYLSYHSATRNPGDLSSIQFALTNSYSLLLGTLYVLVTAIASMSAAFSVVSEKQRFALDLVFSAPFSARRYVLGKIIGNMRFVAILVAVALPAMAAMIVAGGATVEDMLVHGVLLIANAVFYSSIAVALASVARSFLLPLMGTIGIGFLWSIVLISTASVSTFRLLAPAPTHMPASFSLMFATPSLGALSPSTSIDVFGFIMPAWPLTLIVLALITRFAIIAAIAGLEYPSGRSAMALRMNGWAYMGLVGVIVGLSMPRMPGTGFSSVYPMLLVSSFCVSLLVLTLFVTAPFGPDKDVKHKDKSSFEIRRVFRPESSSALPYSFGLLACFWLPVMAMSSTLREFIFYIPVLYSFVLMAFWALIIRGGSFLFSSSHIGRVVGMIMMAGATFLSFPLMLTYEWGPNRGTVGPSVLSMFMPWAASEEIDAWVGLGTVIIYGSMACAGLVWLEVKQRVSRT